MHSKCLHIRFLRLKLRLPPKQSPLFSLAREWRFHSQNSRAKLILLEIYLKHFGVGAPIRRQLLDRVVIPPMGLFYTALGGSLCCQCVPETAGEAFAFDALFRVKLSFLSVCRLLRMVQ